MAVREGLVAVYDKPNAPFELRMFPIREPRAGEVLVKVRMCTICRSDIHSWLGHRPNPTPGVLGHEIIGTKGPVEAIRATGAGPLQTFVFAVLPQVRVAWAGIAIYTWDVVFRASTVVGFFGAGGMGHYLRESVQRVESRQVTAIILTIVAIVIAAELFSAWARARIARAVA